MDQLYRYTWIVLWFAGSLLAACNPSKPLTHKAQKLENAGMYQEAASFYYDAVKYNRKNVEAQIGLKNTGQKVLNDYFDAFFKAYHTDKFKEAIYAYRSADKYFNDLKELGVFLKWDDHYQADYEEALNKYLDLRYNEGQKLIQEGDYASADGVFKEILSLKPKYRDAGSLAQTAMLEPAYQKGVEFLNNKKYVKAYEQFKWICNTSCKYKDTEKLKAEALEKGQFTIGFFTDEKDQKNMELQKKLSGMVMSELSAAKNPFIQVVDRDNIEKLLTEQKLAMSGIVDESKAASAGKIIGIQGAMFARVLDSRRESSPMQKQTRIGFEIVERLSPPDANGNHTLIRKVVPVTYTEYSGSSQVYLNTEFKLVSTETGKILYTKVLNDRNEDNVHYAVSSRTVKLNQVFPTQDGIAGVAATQNFRQMFNARQSLKSSSELENELLQRMARTIAREILEFHKQMDN